MSSLSILSNGIQKLDLDCILHSQPVESGSLTKGLVETDDVGLVAFCKHSPKQVAFIY